MGEDGPLILGSVIPPTRRGMEARVQSGLILLGCDVTAKCVSFQSYDSTRCPPPQCGTVAAAPKKCEPVKEEDAKKKGRRATSVALFIFDSFAESHSWSAELSGDSPGPI